MSSSTTSRWVQDRDNPALLRADLLTSPMPVVADIAAGVVRVADHALTPDGARMLGVWLLDAASRAEGERSIRPATD